MINCEGVQLWVRVKDTAVMVGTFKSYEKYLEWCLKMKVEPKLWNIEDGVIVCVLED